MPISSISDDFSDALLNTSLDGFRQQDIVFEGDGRQRIVEVPDHWIYSRFTPNYSTKINTKGDKYGS